MADQVYPRASGLPDHGYPDGSSYIPKAFADKLMVYFYATSVFAAISNTDYERDISSKGDEVIINQLPASVDIKAHIDGQDLDYDDPEPTDVTLKIDKGFYWGYNINDVFKRQADTKKIDAWADHYARFLSLRIDREVLEYVYPYAHASNLGLTAGAISSSYSVGVSGTPLTWTKDNSLEIVTRCASILTEQNVPQENRWLVLPEIACNKLLNSDLKNASVMGDPTSVLRNGQLGGMIAGMKIYKSNQLLPATDGADTVFNCIFGHPAAITFASQLVVNERIRSERRFGSVARALQVYGREVVKPEALGHLYIKVG